MMNKSSKPTAGYKQKGGSKSLISAEERRKRAAQSKADKERNLKAQLNQSKNPQPRPVARSKLSGVLRCLSSALPSPFKTRLEHYCFKAVFRLGKDKSPYIVFHPSCSSSAGLAFTTNTAGSIKTLTVSSRAAAAFPDWVDDEAVSTTTRSPLFKINADGTWTTAATPVWAEASATPATVISDQMRVVGGLINFKLQCGPSVRGFLTAMDMDDFTSGQEISTYSAKLALMGNKSVPLKAGTHTHTFVACLEDPSKLETYFGAQKSFDWTINDAFTGSLFQFQNVDFSAQDTAPTVTVTMVVALQHRLYPEAAHLSTKHPVATKADLVSTFGTTATSLGEDVVTAAALSQIPSVSTTLEAVIAAMAV